MVEVVNRARRGKPKITRAQLMASFGERGYMLGEVEGELHALVGWNAEDFIARLQQPDIYPAALRSTVGRILLESVCRAAGELMCEVALLFVPADSSGRAMRFYRSCGFAEVTDEDLIPAWRKASQQSGPEGSRVMLRKLRDRRVLRPV